MALAEDFVIRDVVLVSYTGRINQVVIPDNLGIIEITDDAFAHSGVISVVIPNGVKTISSGAFNSCYNLQTLTIPSSVTSIGDNPFRSCANLKQITIIQTGPNSDTSYLRDRLKDYELIFR
jgi:hypothetical protein